MLNESHLDTSEVNRISSTRTNYSYFNQRRDMLFELRGKINEHVEASKSIILGLPFLKMGISQINEALGLEGEPNLDRMRLEYNKQVVLFRKKCHDSLFEFSTENFLHITYNLFLLATENTEYPDWISACKGFDSYIEFYFPEESEMALTPKAKANMIAKVSKFNRDIVGNKHFNIDPSSLRTYSMIGQFIPLYTPKGFRQILISPEIYNEVMYLIDQKIFPLDRRNLLSHSTGSIILDRVSKAKALLAPKTASESGFSVDTGEVNTSVNLNDDPKDLIKIYNQLYFSPGTPHGGYFTTRWFNEHTLGFGIDPSMQAKYLEKLNSKLNSDHSIRNIGNGEGIVVGPSVPLENLKYVFYAKDNESTMRKWISENSPQAIGISTEALEAYDSLQSNLDDLNKGHVGFLKLLQILRKYTPIINSPTYAFSQLQKLAV